MKTLSACLLWCLVAGMFVGCKRDEVGLIQTTMNTSEYSIDLVLPKSFLRGAGWRDYTVNAFPQYPQDTLLCETKYGYFVRLKGRPYFKERDAKRFFRILKEAGANNQDTGYSVVGAFAPSPKNY